jgi:hypothetical protein
MQNTFVSLSSTHLEKIQSTDRQTDRQADRQTDPDNNV